MSVTKIEVYWTFLNFCDKKFFLLFISSFILKEIKPKNIRYYLLPNFTPLKTFNYEYVYAANQKQEHFLYIIIIMSRRQRGYPWPSLAISPYHSSPPAGLQGYIPCPHIAAVCKFVLVVPLLHIHVWGSTGVHRLWARPCFSSSVLRVWFVELYKMLTAPGIPRRSPIQVLTRLDAA